jgi:hypothetical protein
MRRTLCLGGVALLLFAVSGCGGADSLVQEQIKDMNDLAKAFETNAPESVVRNLQKKTEETGKKLQDLKLSDEELKNLIERHKDALLAATVRLQIAMRGKTTEPTAQPGSP